jgi:sec-independent protein translocase protein TatA
MDMDTLLLGMLNTPEIIALLVLALILFGAKKLPELAKGLGHGIKEFKKASRDVTDELNNAMYSEPPPPPPRPPTPMPAPEPPPEAVVAQTQSDPEPPVRAS